MPDDWYTAHPPCPGCPHPVALHAHQRWATMRKQGDRASVDPWLTPEFKRAHPGMGRGELALAWLRETFSRCGQ